MMKIIICDPNYAPNVSPIRTLLLIKVKGWQKMGAMVSFICSTEAKLFYEKELKEINYITFPFTWNTDNRWFTPIEYIRANYSLFPVLFRIINKYDIIYSLSSTLDIIFFPWMLKHFDKNIRWFAVVDNIVPKPNERPGNYILNSIPYIAFLISNQLLKKTDGIFVVTNLLKQYYENKGIVVIKTGTGNGLDIASFKGRIPFGTPRFTALFGARLHPAKGIYDLIEITKMVVKKNKNYKLGIMGYGDEKTKEKMNISIKANNLTKNIYLLGHKNTKERWDLYRSSNFFLFPSYAEGCPQVVLEAFAANMLVIGYDLPEYNDAFRKYIYSKQLILFKKGNIIEIANFIISLKTKKLKFKNKLKNYSWDRIIKNEFRTFTSS